MKKIVKIVSLVFAFMFILCSCGVKNSDNGSNVVTAPDNGEIKHAHVKFTMENGSSFVIELYPEYAPETVKNFETLVRSGFYDGLTFHRVIEGFMAQGGDGASVGKYAESIKGEFLNNGFDQNTLPHDRGVVSMARTNNPDSASSQFFICYSREKCQHLDGNYAAFGKVIEGMETVDAFLEVERVYGADGALSKPVTPIVIEKTEVIG